MNYNGKDEYYAPRQIINALHDAKDEMNYSNYHNNQFALAEKIIRQWCKDNNVILGPTNAAIEKRKKAKHEKIIADLKSDNISVMKRAISRMK